jgi:hypothetical protein
MHPIQHTSSVTHHITSHHDRNPDDVSSEQRSKHYQSSIAPKVEAASLFFFAEKKWNGLFYCDFSSEHAYANGQSGCRHSKLL